MADSQSGVLLGVGTPVEAHDQIFAFLSFSLTIT